MAGLDFAGRYNTQANLGLGRNSTFLNALKNQGHISSRTWSYWPGVKSATFSASKDGHITFGGYDAAKATGPNIAQRLAEPSKGCPSGMSVIVTSMMLDFPNGTKADMLARSTFAACLQLDFPMVMTVPYSPYYERFEDLTSTMSHNRSLGTNWWTSVYDPRETSVTHPGFTCLLLLTIL